MAVDHIQLVPQALLRYGSLPKRDNYIQHNPQIADKLSGLRQVLQAMTEQGITMKYDKIHKVLGEGNFVSVVSEGSFTGQPPTSFYDLFRVENGKIAEHWDMIETIPP